jgi:required for meiotic nuclear division protein 1
VVVTFGPPGSPDPALDAALAGHLEEPLAVPETEEARIAVRPGGGPAAMVHDDRIEPDGLIVLADARAERLLLVATVLSHSVLLARDELSIAQAFDRSAPLVADLRENGRARLAVAEVMKLVGEVLAARHRVTGTVQAGERPDLLWDHPELDRLYQRLEGEYELSERAAALDRKLDALGDLGEALLDIVQTKRSFRLEAAIIALIAFEIVLSLVEMALR